MFSVFTGPCCDTWTQNVTIFSFKYRSTVHIWAKAGFRTLLQHEPVKILSYPCNISMHSLPLRMYMYVHVNIDQLPVAHFALNSRNRIDCMGLLFNHYHPFLLVTSYLRVNFSLNACIVHCHLNVASSQSNYCRSNSEKNLSLKYYSFISTLFTTNCPLIIS